MNDSAATAWPPAHLPAELHGIATAADLIRQETDLQWNGGAGVCLGVSAFVSYLLEDLEIDHRLVNGIYTDSHGEHPHWWIETNSGWILDGSRGQFDHGDTYHSGVIGRFDQSYSLRRSWEPGHGTMELVEAEMLRCFSDSSEAYEYLDLCENTWFEVEDMIHRGIVTVG